MRVRRTLIASSLCALGMAGCGGSTDESSEATKAATGYYTALAAGNAAAVCDALSASGRQQLVDDVAAIGGAANCVDAARKARAILSAYLTPAAFGQIGQTEAGAARVDGSSATVAMPFTRTLSPEQVRLVKEKAGWKVNQVSSRGADPAAVTILPKLPGDQRPRVEGRWRVVYTGVGADDPARTTWKTTANCDVGACDFKAKSSYRHSKFAFKLDKTVGDYTSKKVTKDDCTRTSGEVVQKDGYRGVDTWAMHVTKAVFAAGKQVATEMRADRRQTISTTSEASAQGCSDATDDQQPTERVRLIRIDAPAGDEVPVPSANDDASSTASE